VTSTFTPRIVRRTELRSDTPLTKVIESFFVSNSMRSKTKEFYQGNFSAYVRFLKGVIEREPTLADLDKDYVNAYLRELERKPTPKYPEGSPFRARAACTSLKRLAHWLVEEHVLRESPLDGIKKTSEPKDVRQPLTDQELEQVRFGAGRLALATTPSLSSAQPRACGPTSCANFEWATSTLRTAKSRFERRPVRSSDPASLTSTSPWRARWIATFAAGTTSTTPIRYSQPTKTSSSPSMASASSLVGSRGGLASDVFTLTCFATPGPPIG